MDWREDSFVREASGRGFGSNAARFPRSKDKGIAFCGLHSLERSMKSKMGCTQCLLGPWLLKPSFRSK
jgi:hypothetical protein